jgi:hypothetical protein
MSGFGNVTDCRRRGFAKSARTGVGSRCYLGQALRDVRIRRLVFVVGRFDLLAGLDGQWTRMALGE